MENKRPCVEISVGALTGTVSGTFLWDDEHPGLCTFSSYDKRVYRYYAKLCDGGYVIDKTVLAEDPHIASWAWKQPLQNGRLTSDRDSVFTEEERQEVDEIFLVGLSGAFRDVALMMHFGLDKNDPGEASAFDKVSAEELAAWWMKRGARIGKRMGNTLTWSDGTQEEIIDYGE